MKTILFDVDDTAYDQLSPFEKAITKNFSIDSILIEKLYKISRQLSDEVFYLTENGQMNLKEMHIFRIKKALEKINLYITEDEATNFQNDYEYFQSKINLIPDIEESLNFCLKHNILMGIITNGPMEHQKRKIKQLNLKKWIPENNIFISSEIGFAKPDKKIFEFVEKKMMLDKNNTYFVGDSFLNDVVGAKRAGWNAIWVNRRNQEYSEQAIKPDFVVDKNSLLLPVLHEIVLS